MISDWIPSLLCFGVSLTFFEFPLAINDEMSIVGVVIIFLFSIDIKMADVLSSSSESGKYCLITLT